MKKIAAVVVTYNRKKLLLNCVEALLNQTKKISKIIIVDNNSDDGTQEYLKKRDILANNIIDYNYLDNNLGGAGGFHFGLKKAFKEGFDYFYLMDDDGIPSSTALENLVKCSEKNSFHYINSLVLNKKNKKELSFGLIHNNKKHNYLNDIKKIDNNFIIGSANPFNGLLLTYDLVDKVGFPKKEMFIWGDETEYLLRTKSYNYSIVTCFDSIHYHPKNKKNEISFLNNLFSIKLTKNKFKNYIFLRNQFYNSKKYCNRKFWFLSKLVINAFLASLIINKSYYNFSLFKDSFIDAKKENFIDIDILRSKY